MVTRCQIGFFKKETDRIVKQWRGEAYVYRHRDGYPGTVDGSEYGVLPDIMPFLKEFKKHRGLHDTAYATARLCQYFGNLRDKEIDEINKERGRTAVDKESYFLGLGIDSVIHSDIKYFYHVSPHKIKVYEVNSPNPKDWTVLETHEI